MNACKAVRKGVPLNKGLDDLRKNLGKDLWAHQSKTVVFLYETLMAETRLQIGVTALSIAVGLALFYCLKFKPDLVTTMLGILFVLQIRLLGESVWTWRVWQKLPETGKMPTKIAKGDLE
jgi:hypothetical protein